MLTLAWGRKLRRPDYIPPKILPSRSDAVTEVRQIKRFERLRHIFSRGRPTSAWSDSLDLDEDLRAESSARVLYAAIIRRAFLDYACGVVSPLGRDQRRALNAYWWVMGLPFTVTEHVRQAEPQALKDLSRGRDKNWRSRSGPRNPFGDVEITFEQMLEGSTWSSSYLPDDVFPELGQQAQFTNMMNFLSCCDVCGLDSSLSRKWLHLVRPDGTPTSQHEREDAVPEDFKSGDAARLLEVRLNSTTSTSKGVCPSCGVKASGLREVDAVFGFRRMQSKVGDTVFRRQSYCLRCRGRYKSGG